LTVEYINALLKKFGLMTDEIDGHSRELLRYSKLIKYGRNRLVTHLDVESIISREPIGEHSEEDLAVFLESLQYYIDAVGSAVGVGPIDFSVTAGPGDVEDLIERLKIQV
jgi:hypothetical protein